MVSMGLRAETEVTVLLPFCECAEERVLGDGSFGVVYKERYPGNAVAAKMKLRPLLQSMAEFCRRSRCMKGSTRAHQHPRRVPSQLHRAGDGYAPCGSLSDCIMNRSEPGERVTLGTRLTQRMAVHSCKRTRPAP